MAAVFPPSVVARWRTPLAAHPAVGGARPRSATGCCAEPAPAARRAALSPPTDAVTRGRRVTGPRPRPAVRRAPAPQAGSGREHALIAAAAPGNDACGERPADVQRAHGASGEASRCRTRRYDGGRRTEAGHPRSSAVSARLEAGRGSAVSLWALPPALFEPVDQARRARVRRLAVPPTDVQVGLLALAVRLHGERRGTSMMTKPATPSSGVLFTVPKTTRARPAMITAAAKTADAARGTAGRWRAPPRRTWGPRQATARSARTAAARVPRAARHSSPVVGRPGWTDRPASQSAAYRQVYEGLRGSESGTIVTARVDFPRSSTRGVSQVLREWAAGRSD